jgi:hypothetical protein
MKHMVQRISRGILSAITTFVLMAAPVAAIVYSSDSTEKQAESIFASAPKSISWQVQNSDADQQEKEQIVAMKVRKRN